jgi:HsdM N-terminal domain
MIRKRKTMALTSATKPSFGKCGRVAGSVDAAEYKHVVLGLIFLKYISDAFEEQHAKLEAAEF